MNQITPALFYALMATVLGFVSFYFALKSMRKSEQENVTRHFPGYRKYYNLLHGFRLVLLNLHFNFLRRMNKAQDWDTEPYLHMFKKFGAKSLVYSMDDPSKFEGRTRPVLDVYTWFCGTYIEFEGAVGKGTVIILTSWAHPQESRTTIFLFEGNLNMNVIVSEYIKWAYDAKHVHDK